MNRSPESREQGFVLIAALWLLLLCGALVGLLMLKSLRSSESGRERASEAQGRFDMDAALHTIAADMLFRGGASQWMHLPARGVITVEDRSVDISMTAESGRLDLNETDLATIDRALLGQVPASDRAEFIGKLQQMRARGQVVGSLLEVAQLVPPASSKNCVVDWFTIYAGSGNVQGRASPQGLSNALVLPTVERSDSAVRIGEAVRVEVRPAGEGGAVAVIRLRATRDKPFDILAWLPINSCKIS